MRFNGGALLVLASLAPVTAGDASISIASQCLYTPALLLSLWACKHHGLAPLTPKRLFFVFLVAFFVLRVGFFAYTQTHERALNDAAATCWNFVSTNPRCPGAISLDVAGFAANFINLVIVLWCFLLRSAMPRKTRRRITGAFFCGCFAYVLGLVLIVLVPQLYARHHYSSSADESEQVTRYVNVYIGAFALAVEILFFARGVNVVLRLRRLARGRSRTGGSGRSNRRLLRTYRYAAGAICLAFGVYTARCVFVISRWDSWRNSKSASIAMLSERQRVYATMMAYWLPDLVPSLLLALLMWGPQGGKKGGLLRARSGRAGGTVIGVSHSFLGPVDASMDRPISQIVDFTGNPTNPKGGVLLHEPLLAYGGSTEDSWGEDRDSEGGAEGAQLVERVPWGVIRGGRATAPPASAAWIKAALTPYGFPVLGPLCKQGGAERSGREVRNEHPRESSSVPTGSTLALLRGSPQPEAHASFASPSKTRLLPGFLSPRSTPKALKVTVSRSTDDLAAAAAAAGSSAASSPAQSRDSSRDCSREGSPVALPGMEDVASDEDEALGVVLDRQTGAPLPPAFASPTHRPTHRRGKGSKADVLGGGDGVGVNDGTGEPERMLQVSMSVRITDLVTPRLEAAMGAARKRDAVVRGAARTTMSERGFLTSRSQGSSSRRAHETNPVRPERSV